jgi:hypothetical protein
MKQSNKQTRQNQRKRQNGGKRNQNQNQNGGAGAHTYAEHVFDEKAAVNNVVGMKADYAIPQHNGAQSGGSVLLPLSPAAVEAMTDKVPDLQQGGKLDLTTMAVPAALLISNQLYSRRKLAKTSRRKSMRRFSRRRPASRK